MPSLEVPFALSSLRLILVNWVRIRTILALYLVLGIQITFSLIPILNTLIECGYIYWVWMG
jgi:hypothetical protein